MKQKNNPHVKSSRKEVRCTKKVTCLETDNANKYAGSADNPKKQEENTSGVDSLNETSILFGDKKFDDMPPYWKMGYKVGKKQALTSEIEFLESCFLNKSLLCSIDGLAEKLDGDELILIHKLVDMANEQNKSVILRIAESSRMLRILDGVQKPKVSDVKGALSE